MKTIDSKIKNFLLSGLVFLSSIAGVYGEPIKFPEGFENYKEKASETRSRTVLCGDTLCSTIRYFFKGKEFPRVIEICPFYPGEGGASFSSEFPVLYGFDTNHNGFFEPGEIFPPEQMRKFIIKDPEIFHDLI